MINLLISFYKIIWTRYATAWSDPAYQERRYTNALRSFMNKCICAFVSFMNICKQDQISEDGIRGTFGPVMLRPAAKIDRKIDPLDCEIGDSFRLSTDQFKLLVTKHVNQVFQNYISLWKETRTFTRNVTNQESLIVSLPAS